MQKPNKKPEFMCLSPWCHTHMSPVGERRLCCASREPAQNFKQYIDTDGGSGKFVPYPLEDWWNSEQVREVRVQMMRGEMPKACEVCNKKLLNVSVYRDYFWYLFNHRYDEVWETTDKFGYTTMRPRSWDYRFSNLCNFKCRMCGPPLSSSWETEAKQHGYNESDPANNWMREPVRSQIRSWQEDELGRTFLAELEKGTVEEIYWVGGEPLMFEQHWSSMKRIVDLGYADRVYVRYNTNLSRTEYKRIHLWDTLRNFRDWEICASLDGVGERGEYIRTGLKYDQWLKNFEEGLRSRKHENQMKIDFTLTTPGLLEIPNIVNLSQQYDVPLLSKTTFAFSPDILLSPNALPRDLRDYLIGEKLTWLSKNAGPKQQSMVDLLNEILRKPTFQEEYAGTWKHASKAGKEYLQKLDRIRPGPNMEDILEADPLLLEWWNRIDE